MGSVGYEQILYGPDGEQFNTYAAVTLGTERWPFGTQMVMQDGRKYRFARAGGVLLVVGNLLTVSGDNTETNLTAAAGAIGDKLITLTAAGTEAANYFAQGYATVSVTPGGGDSYKILGHATLAASSGQVINLTSTGGLRRALTTTSRVDLVEHPYKGVIQSAVTTLAAVPCGVAVSAIALNGCGWVQTRGVAGVLTNGTLVIGNRAVAPSGAAGAVGPETAVAANSKIEYTIGGVMDVAAGSAWSTIFLTIDG